MEAVGCASFAGIAQVPVREEAYESSSTGMHLQIPSTCFWSIRRANRKISQGQLKILSKLIKEWLE
jgi:hypothetical protein